MNTIKSVTKTSYESQLGLDIVIINDKSQETTLSVFCDCIEPDNVRIMANIDGEDSLIMTTVGESNFISPTFKVRPLSIACEIHFDDISLIVHISGNSVLITVTQDDEEIDFKEIGIF